jgi:hypothetical protein
MEKELEYDPMEESTWVIGKLITYTDTVLITGQMEECTKERITKI